MSTSSNQRSVVELPPKLLGLSGTVGSGKDTIAAWLNQKYKYYHVSTGDIVREVAQARFGSTERPYLHKTANALRQERGGGVLVELALEHYAPVATTYPGGLVISGVRSIGEAKAIKANAGWLLFVDAPAEARYERAHLRARGDEGKLDFAEFKKRDDSEISPNNQTDEDIQNLGMVEQMADTTIYNEHDKQRFLNEIADVLDLPKR